MKINKKNFKQNHSKNQLGNGAKFLYQRQEKRKNLRKSEEDFYEKEDSDLENEGNEAFEESENNEESVENSDSDSEGEIYKDEIKTNNLDLKDDLNDVKLSNEEKEKINSFYLESIESCKDLKNKIEMTRQFIRNDDNQTKYGLSFLDSKNGLMIMYETYLIIYSMMKLSGLKIERNFPSGDSNFEEDKNIFKNLVTCKTFLEKIKTIDIKLKSQIERFIKLSEQDINQNDEDENNEETMRPKILEEDDSEESDENLELDKSKKVKKSKEESGFQEDKQKMKQDLKYKVKKNFQEFFETKEDNKKRQKKIIKLKEKIQNSEYYNSLKEEFTDKPKEFKSESTHLEKLMKDVEDYEDDHMMRIKIPKREIKLARKRDRDEFAMKDLGEEFKQFDRILKNDMKDELEEHEKNNKLKQISTANNGKKHHFNKANKGMKFKKFKK